MWIGALMFVFFAAGYALGKSQHGKEGGAFRSKSHEATVETIEGRQTQFGHLVPVILALKQLGGQQLGTSHMDGLLDLNDLMSEETKRSRRARAISDINAWGWTEFDRPVLTRIRDEEDRRRTLYLVDAFELPAWLSATT